MTNCSNVRDEVEAVWVADSETSLGAPAKNRAQRHQALTWCLNERWASSNLGRIERCDSEEYHGWGMWRWKKGDG